MNSNMNFEHMPHFKVKRHKLLAAIMFLIEEAAKIGCLLTKGEIVKSLFIADDRHLANEGRPITFDNYVAMQNGPVGDLALDLLNDRGIDWSVFGLSTAPWTVIIDGNRTRYASGSVPARRDELSLTDEDELSAALAHVQRSGFGRISGETHDHPAWTSAWHEREAGANAAAMDWRRFPAMDTNAFADLVCSSWSAA